MGSSVFSSTVVKRSSFGLLLLGGILMWMFYLLFVSMVGGSQKLVWTALATKGTSEGDESS